MINRFLALKSEVPLVYSTIICIQLGYSLIKRSKIDIAPVLAAFFIALLCFYTLDSYFGKTVGRVTIQGKFPAGTSLQIVAENKFGHILSESVDLGDKPVGTLKRVGSGRINWPARKVLLNFFVPISEVQAGRDVLNIYSLQFEQPFSGLFVVPQEHLSEVFESSQYFGENSSFLRVDSHGVGSMVLKKPLPRAARLWALLPSLFIGFLVWLIIKNNRLRDIPAFKDMSLGRKISSNHEFDTVNGLRGLAALLVLFSHAAPGFEAVNVGIALLFVISGFLLSKPFVLDSSRVFNWPNVESYLVKRVKRILPMYYLFIFISYVLTYQFDTALRNFLFVEASGHLWPMTQIFTFYISLPLVLVLTSLLWKWHRALPVIALFVLGWFWFEYMTDWKPYYNGRYFKEFYLYAFLMGVAGAYIQFDLLKRLDLSRYQQPLAILLLLLIVLTVAWSAPVSPPKWIYPFISEFYGKCFLSLTMVILALQVQGTWVNTLIANSVFRSIGVVGFSFYLLHGMGMELATHLQINIFGIVEPLQRSWPFTAMAFGFTYVMSLFTYSYVERPFFGYREKTT